MIKLYIRLGLYLLAIGFILIEPDFALLLGVIWGGVVLWGKIKDKQVLIFKIKK